MDALYAGVELVFHSRSEFVCHITICRKRKGQLEIVSQESEKNLHETKKILKKVSAFYLLVTGRPVIHKKLSRFYDNPQELTTNLLPDAKQGEFVSQCFEYNSSFYGAVLRKEALQEVIKPFNEARLFPQTVLLGPAVMGLLPALLNEEINFSTTAYSVSIADQGVTFNGPADQPERLITIGNDQVNTWNVPALCTCIQGQAQMISATVIDDILVKQAASEAIQKRRFRKLSALIVTVLFVLTTGNFLFNRSYAKEHEQLDEALALNRQMLTEIEKLEKDIDEKKSLLGQRPASSGPVISLIGDRIGASVPQKIRLQNLEIFPLQGKISKEKPIGFSFNKVTIEGVSTESDVLDKWIQQCKRFDWVKDVLIVKYNFDHEKKKGFFKLEFLLQ